VLIYLLRAPEQVMKFAEDLVRFDIFSPFDQSMRMKFSVHTAGRAVPRPPKKPPFIPTDIAPIACPRCGAKANLIHRAPLPAGLKGEMRTCKKCGKQTKIIVQEL
jgi:hypothetical protein